MTDKNKFQFRLQIWLSLMALHSCVVGFGLIWHPANLLAQFGYAPVSEPFFPAQGGVFHIIMALGYALAANQPFRFSGLIFFSVVVKIVATLFLLAYWLTNPGLWLVLVSGLGDGVMALVLGNLYLKWKPTEPVKETP